MWCGSVQYNPLGKPLTDIMHDCFHGLYSLKDDIVHYVSLLVSIRIMPAWKWLEFKDFIVDFDNKKDCYTIGDVLGTLCTSLHKPVLRIVPKNE